MLASESSNQVASSSELNELLMRALLKLRFAVNEGSHLRSSRFEFCLGWYNGGCFNTDAISRRGCGVDEKNFSAELAANGDGLFQRPAGVVGEVCCNENAVEKDLAGCEI